MSAFEATLILLLATGIAFVIAAPILYLLRRRQRKSRNQEGASTQVPAAEAGPFTQRVRLVALLPALLGILATYFLLAQEFIDPAGWLGSRLSAPNGKFWFWLLAVLVFWLLEVGTRQVLQAWLRRRQQSRQPRR